MRRLAALLLILSSPALAKTSAIVGIALDQSSTVKPASQPLSTPAGETGQIGITVTHPDGTAYNLTGAQLLLAVGSKISRQATIDNAATGTAHFPLVIADTINMLGTYSYDVTLTATDGSFYRIVPASSFVVTAGIGQPGQAVTVPATQQPLAQGPAGPQGPAGAAGAAGPTGPQGPSGTSGTLTVSAPLTGGGVMSSNVPLGVDSTVPHCSPTTSGDYCGWNGSAWVREPAPTGGGATGLPTVYFPGLSGGGVNSLANAGLFWPSPGGVAVNLGTRFCYEGWFDYRDSGSVYIISDGAGGAHALLWDGVGGNMFLDDGSNVSFGGDDPPPPNVFSFLRVAGTTDALGANYIIASINGVPVGRVLIPSGRQRATQVSAGGFFYLGGSDHQNAQFYMAWLEAWDQYNPWFQAASGPNYVNAYVPPRFPRQTVVRTSDGVSIPVDILLDATKATAGSIPDLSLGYGPGTAPKIKHDAYFWTVPGGRSIVSGGSSTDPNPDLPLPTVVYRTGTPLDPTNPYPGAPDRGLTPPATPAGAKIFDSFSRPDQELAHVKAPTLGTTEAGSLGVKTWQYGCIATPTMRPSQWGIFNGRAVTFTSDYSCIAYVTNDSADMTVLVDRRKGAWGDGATGIAFRVQDSSNFWYSHYSCNSGNAELDTGYYSAGNRTNRSSVSIPCSTAWTTLEIDAVGSTITVKTDGTTKATITDSTFSTATGVGLAGASAYDVGGSLGLWRADNFTVK